MKLGSKFRMNLIKVAVITVCWVIISALFPLHDRVVIFDDRSLGPSQIYDFEEDLWASMLGGFLGGIFGGSGLVFLLPKKLIKKSFMSSIIATAVYYVLIFAFNVILLTFIFGVPGMEKPIFHPEVLNAIFKLITAPLVLSTFIEWGLIVSATQFMLQVNDKFGQGVLKNFLLGKYRRPREEQRIFMFLDLKSSTAIAEQIGNRKYFNLLRDFYSDITNAIISTRGEIYQYVGDEIVISWSLTNGVTNANCLQCFFRIREVIEQLASVYEQRYGLIPEFKAGLHSGNVTAGEIGIIKRDIIFSGDVMNTASRIQEQCNIYKVNILVSKQIIDLMEDLKQFDPIYIGEIKLKGKQEKVELNTIKVA